MIRLLAGIGLSALMLAGCAGGSLPGSSRGANAATSDAAARHATAARKALLGRGHKAVAEAEAAVALRGEDPDYRALLGRAYLRAGRFASAEQAFADTLVLRPDDGAAALNLALAQIAGGKWDKARDVMDRHAATIPAVDRGLALALAGNPGGAVEVLTQAMRAPGADARVRQNLGLALALAGEWRDARLLAGIDLDPVAADRRVMEWAAFAHPRAAADQVAALLRVTPAADPGQPIALALARATPENAVAAVDRYMPGVAEAPAPSITAPTSATAASPVAVPSAVADRPRVATRAPAPGKWFIQIGAYANAAVARDGWARIVRRIPALADATPRGIAPSRRSRFYRLSTGGFAYGDAAALCRTLRTGRGTCYVRLTEGERVAAWHRASPLRLAGLSPRSRGRPSTSR